MFTSVQGSLIIGLDWTFGRYDVVLPLQKRVEELQLNS
jgi:hypothetical protein